ncbi:MAG: hypothetical protein ISR65_10685 [Bacteriovoracaceae bacterium]|nr:hypothetical protein [Bacteriovoracaceae bacterium]
MKHLAVAITVMFSLVVGTAVCATIPKMKVPKVTQIGLEKLSYGELAKKSVYSLYKDMLDELKKFDKKILPHEAKALRKQIGNTRGYIDLFPFAYKSEKGLAELRDGLDEGYEVMGEFKDLYDIQGVDVDDADYDKDEVKKLRNAVLDWKDSFGKSSRQKEFKDLLANPAKKIVDIKRKNLSRFFWGGVDQKPLNRLTGVENISRLAKNLLDLARDDYDDAKQLDDVLDHEEAESFHDFRKRIRTVLKITAFFPHIVEDTSKKVDNSFDTLNVLVGKYGDINDSITAHFKYLEDDRDKKAKDAAKKAEKEFKKLKKWQKEEEIDAVVETFLDALV